MASKKNLKYWAIIPAAGRGLRMGAKKPKQYLTIAGKTILEHSAEPLLNNDKISKVIIAIAPQDSYFRTLPIAKHPKVIVAEGGNERCHTVFNALEALQTYAYDDDWVLVHDAARPLLSKQDVNTLMLELEGEKAGGLLGVPIHATIKRVNDQQEVLETVSRRQLWRAFTPQMFRFGLLYQALTATLPDNPTSDSAKAMEQMGHCIKMIEGRSDNIKITRPSDMLIAEQILQNKGEF